MKNLLDPLIFSDTEASKFVRDNVCATCRGALSLKPYGHRQWKAYCPHCGDVYEHNTMTKAQAERAEAGELFGERELREDKPPRNPDDILKELGF